MVKLTSLDWVPKTPGAPSRSLSRRFTVTRVPGFQYSSGRKSRRLALNQWPTISTGGAAVTVIAFCTSAWAVTGLSKVMETGMPTPTVVPVSGV